MAVASAGREASTRRLPAFTRALGVASLVVIADRITKHAVKGGIAVGHEHTVFSWLKLVHIRNTGVAFNFLAGGGALVLAVTVAALALLVGYFWLRPWRRGLWVPTGLLVGGAVGNLIDRLGSGSVTDFIKLPHWPAFNVSDIAITIGVLALLWVVERGDRGAN